MKAIALYQPRNPRKLLPWYRRRNVYHTVSELIPVLQEGDRVLDVGCGYGEVAWMLSGCHPGKIWTVDIADFRGVLTPYFKVYNGIDLPFDDGAFDVVLLAFVLHHVPNDHKAALLREARRVTRRNVVVLEDTPRTWLDKIISRLHGEEYRRRIGSKAEFGFFNQAEWTRFFDSCGLKITTCKPCSRFCRSRAQPFARTTFILERNGSSGSV